jgi:hypothetical protein
VVGGASAGVEKDPGSLGFARDDTIRSGEHISLGMTQDAGDRKRNRERNGGYAICDLYFSWVQGLPLPRKFETREGFHVGLSDLPLPRCCVDKRGWGLDNQSPNGTNYC